MLSITQRLVYVGMLKAKMLSFAWYYVNVHRQILSVAVSTGKGGILKSGRKLTVFSWGENLNTFGRRHMWIWTEMTVNKMKLNRKRKRERKKEERKKACRLQINHKWNEESKETFKTCNIFKIFYYTYSGTHFRRALYLGKTEWLGT